MSVERVVGDSAQLTWFKSSYSTGEPGSDCVEIATSARIVHVRDSKHATGTRLRFGAGAWAAFLTYASGRS